MNFIKRILDYSYHARDVRALDPATGKPIPRAGDPSIWIRAGAMMMNASWAKRNVLKYIYTITAPLSAWLAAHGGGEHTAAIVAGVIAAATFLFDRLTSWLNDQATMKIPPHVGAPTARQEHESIEAYSGMNPAQPFTSNSGQTFTSSAMFKAIIAKPTSPSEDDAALLELRESLLKPAPTIPTAAEQEATRANLYGYSVEVDGTVHDFLDKFAAIQFRNNARADGKRATLLF